MMRIIGNIVLAIALLLTGHQALAQKNYRLSGHVTDKNNGRGIEMAVIRIESPDRWTTSDDQGSFSFENLPEGQYSVHVSYLGYEPSLQTVQLSDRTRSLEISMVPSNLSLPEVVVTAKENVGIGSSSRIDQAALEHIQPTDLADVMQLVPGQITINPDLSKQSLISLRDINTAKDPDLNGSLGTAIVVDGTPVNVNGNLQSLNAESESMRQSYAAAGKGADLRRFSTDMIESVEVIRGIPSVQYGDLTTGAVLVTTKEGRTDWQLRVKSDPEIKQLAISKGFQLPGKSGGVLNVDVDYAKAMDDLRLPAQGYNRLTSQVGYNNTFFKNTHPLELHLKVSGYRTLDENKRDPDMLRDEIIREKEMGTGFKLYGNWWLQKGWLTSLSYHIAADYSKQELFQRSTVSNTGVNAMPTSLTSGIAQGTFLPSTYTSDLNIDGIPFSLFTSLKANFFKKYGRLASRLMLGTEWRLSGNQGKGTQWDMNTPPYYSNTSRPTSFRAIPGLHDLALYAEDNSELPVGKTLIQSQIGVRYNNRMPDGFLGSRQISSLEPRVNLTWQLWKNNAYQVKAFSLRFGYGLTSKSPALFYLHPGSNYQDEVGFNYYPDLLVVTTHVIDQTANPQLKPVRNQKFEVGADWNIGGVRVALTAFEEHIRDGYTFEDQYYVMDYKKWDALSGAGKKPVFQNGAVTYTENGVTKQVPYAMKSDFHSYALPSNNSNADKKGIEYVINFGQYKKLRTSLTVDGAYYHITRMDDVLPYARKITSSYLGDRFPLLSVMPGGKSNIHQRLNTNFRLITHIPEIRMIVSLNAQVIWMDKTAFYWNSNGEAVAYSLSDKNERTYGVYDQGKPLYVDPVGYYDKQMQFHPWDVQTSSAAPYATMVQSLDSNYFLNENYPVYWQLNLKVTKEIGKRVRFSFFGNNLFNNRPYVEVVRSSSYIRMNQPAYFGAELTILY
ncbi:MAG: TonB-dependent receptor [Marinilabiliales bacterium]|nr:TonB-dependent receptor [Marinilabiliales bacterium]